MMSQGHSLGGGSGSTAPGSREGVTNWADKNILKNKFIFCIKKILNE